MFILKILYNLLIIILVPFILPIGYLFAEARKESENYFQRFGFITFPEPPEKMVWFHCASVGEVRSLKRLINLFERTYPDVKFMISTTTATGRKIAEKELKPFFSFLLPIENSLAISYIMHCMNVKATVIIDTELWPNFIQATSNRAPLFLVNARISDKSIKGYKKIRFVTSLLLNKFTHIFTKSDIDTERFAYLKGNPENITTLGNIKFNEFETEPDISAVSHITDKPFVIAASTHKGEEKLVVDAFLNSGFNGRLIIAPRHINRVEECLNILKNAGLKPCVLSEFSKESNAVVIDSFGKLEALYKLADKIFIGGSIAKVGGHNIFEALQFGKHIAVGENMQNFKEIYDVASEFSLVTTCSTENELSTFFSSIQTEGNFDGFHKWVQHSADERLKTFLEALRFVLTN